MMATRIKVAVIAARLTGTYPARDCFTNPNCVSYSYGYSHTYRHSYTDMYAVTHSYIHPDSYSHGDIHADSHSHSHIYADTHSYVYADSHSHSHIHTYSHIHADSHTYRHSHSHSYFHSNSNAYGNPADGDRHEQGLQRKNCGDHLPEQYGSGPNPLAPARHDLAAGYEWQPVEDRNEQWDRYHYL